MLYHIYDVRGKRVDCIDGKDAADALQYAKKLYPGASVDRWLDEREQRNKDYQDQCDAWEMMKDYV